MVYDAVLILGVLFAVGYLVLAPQQWSYPLSFSQRAALQASLFAAVGIYFVFCWTRTGQTLALKAWRLKVVDIGAGRQVAYARSRVTCSRGTSGCRDWRSVRCCRELPSGRC